HCPHIIAEEAAGWLGIREAVDGFEEREAPARSQHAEELRKRHLLGRHEDEHRARGDHIYRGIGQEREIVSGGANEVTLTQPSQLLRTLSAVVNQLLGDVAKEPPALRSHAIQGGERDEPVATANI